MKMVIASSVFALIALDSARAALEPVGLHSLVAERERLVEIFRRSDVHDLHDVSTAVMAFRVGATPLADAFGALANSENGDQRVLAQLERAATLLQIGRSEDSATLYEQVAHEAERLGDKPSTFRAWIGAARGMDDQRRYGDSERDFQRAVKVAGAAPTPSERSDIAAYGAQFQSARGEYEAALASAFESERFALNRVDHYYAATALSDIFFHLANSCGERLLIDSRSAEIGDDGTGACRRAVTATKSWEARARSIATSEGWPLLNFGATRRMDVAAGSPAWEGRLQIGRHVVASPLYRPTDARQIGVTENFWSSLAPAIGDKSTLFAQLLGQMKDSQALLAPVAGPTALSLQAEAAELKGNPEESLRLDRLAAQKLIDSRRDYFDPEARGTLTEKDLSVPRDLALRLLQQGARAEAFDLLESFRARGLSEVTAAVAQPGVTPDDRAWLAAVALDDAKLGAAQKRLQEAALGSEGAAPDNGVLDNIDALRRHRAALMEDTVHRGRLDYSSAGQARLDDLTAAVAREHIPVLLYWSTWPLTVAWLITPVKVTVRSDLRNGPALADRVNVRSITLNEPVLIDRVRRVRASAAEEGVAFDAEAARQLYLFLIAPFEAELGDGQIMIIPQGALTDLPFETLIDAHGQFLAERWAVSYAPSATAAVSALSRPAAVPMQVAAVQDETIVSGEIEAMRKLPGLKMDVIASQRTGIADLARLVAQAPVLHILVHGEFDDDDPLLSELKLGKPLVAADLLKLQMTRTRLAVLSACEGAAQYRRLSNELYGFPWALQVAGAQNAVMSRWSVPSEANATWIPAFYAGLGKGLSPANAAARASRDMLASGDRHPHRWAAMQVMGR